MNIIKLCPACEQSLLEEIADLPESEISGFYCDHNHAAAVVVSKKGAVQYAQVSGPCSEEQARAIMPEIAGELYRASIAEGVAAGSAEVRH